jgi:uncharacterized protein (TIGR00369 family)
MVKMERKDDLEDLKATLIQALNSSPYYRLLGMEVLELGEGRSRLRIRVRQDHHNLYGILHGGVIASLLDSTCTIALASLLEVGETAVTVDQRINYISNISQGELYGEGRAIHRGRFTGVSQGEVRDQEGKLVAVGMATIFIIRPGESGARVPGK